MKLDADLEMPPVTLLEEGADLSGTVWDDEAEMAAFATSMRTAAAPK